MLAAAATGAEVIWAGPERRGLYGAENAHFSLPRRTVEMLNEGSFLIFETSFGNGVRFGI